MSLLVPWTDPGGTPCCCDDACPTDQNGPDATYSPGTYIAIEQSDYDALLAGGTFTMDLSIAISGTSSEFPDFVETATASLVNVPLETRTSVIGSLPCFNQLIVTEEIFTEHELSGPGAESSPIEQRPIEINFTYALASLSEGRAISLANAKDAQGQGQNRFVAKIGSLSGLDLPTNTFITVSNPLYIDPLPQANGVVVSLDLVMPSAAYAADNLARVVYAYDPGLTGNVQGSFNMSVFYSPAAP